MWGPAGSPPATPIPEGRVPVVGRPPPTPEAPVIAGERTQTAAARAVSRPGWRARHGCAPGLMRQRLASYRGRAGCWLSKKAASLDNGEIARRFRTRPPVHRAGEDAGFASTVATPFDRRAGRFRGRVRRSSAAILAWRDRGGEAPSRLPKSVRRSPDYVHRSRAPRSLQAAQRRPPVNRTRIRAGPALPPGRKRR